MRNRFDEQLHTLNHELLEMGALIERAIRSATDALVKQDVEAALQAIAADKELVERIAKDDMVRGITVACGGFFGPQGRELRVPLTDPNQNEKLENFEYNGKHITNFEMESSALAGLARLMGHKATTVCMVIANRRIKKADTSYKNHIDNLIKEVLERL